MIKSRAILNRTGDLLPLTLSFLFCFLIFQEDLGFILAHDEIPPYFEPAHKFYLADLGEFLSLLISPGQTYGHPPLLPAALGAFMKFFGAGALQAKVFILLFSSFFFHALYLLGLRFFGTPWMFALLAPLCASLTVYHQNFPLLLGDTFALPLTAYFLYHYLVKNYQLALVFGVLAGLSRESFLFFLAGCAATEALPFLRREKRAFFRLKVLAASAFPLAFWFACNKVATGSFIHTYARTFSDKQRSGFVFEGEFWLRNALGQLEIWLWSEPLIFLGFLLCVFLTVFHKHQLNEFQRRLCYCAFWSNGLTLAILGFYNFLLGRYMLHGMYLFLFPLLLPLAWGLRAPSFKKRLTVIAACALAASMYIKSQFPIPPDSLYGKSAEDQYKASMNALDWLAGKERLGPGNPLPIYACFPLGPYVQNQMNLYSERKEFYLLELRDAAKVIDSDKLYILCRTHPKKQFFGSLDEVKHHADLVYETNVGKQVVGVYTLDLSLIR